MNKIFLKITSVLVIALGIFACSDYLDVDVNNQLAVDNFYKTDDDANQAVLAAYDILQWHENAWAWASPLLVKTFPSDEGQAGGPNAGDQPAYVALDRLDFDASSTPVEAAWSINYYGIYRANLVVNNVDADSDVKKRVIAEAKALRAYYYLELAIMFGDAPLVLTELVPSEYNQPRVAKAQIYAQIEEDLRAAMADLPLKSEYSQSDKFRMAKGTAAALLGKAQLMQEKYGEAATTFGDLILTNEYDLEPNFGDVFMEQGELGTESVMEAVYIETAGYDWGANGFPWGARSESNIHIQLMGAREGTFSGVDSLNNGWGFNYPSQKLWDAYIAAGDEVRRQSTVMSQQEYLDAGGVIDPAIVNPTEDIFDYDGFLRRKYGSFSTEGGEGVFQLNYGTNWRLIRYADILLLAAEAYHKSGNDGQAQIELNKVRMRAGLDDVTAGGDALMEAIMNERFLELAFEGHRYLDLIRWGKAAEEIPGFVTGKHELYPIPQNELLRATELQQNPNW